MGSFPLTRGKPVERDGGGRGVGLIPAHAGKTTRRSPPSWTHRAHPRSRGENGTWASSSTPASGSSPLTRGKLSAATRRVLDRGLIPAHAGKTLLVVDGHLGRRAHPRSRGENSQRAAGDGSNTGSSPLTRGKQGDGMCAFGGFGLIPAHAGKTVTCCPPHLRAGSWRILGVVATHAMP